MFSPKLRCQVAKSLQLHLIYCQVLKIFDEQPRICVRLFFRNVPVLTGKISFISVSGNLYSKNLYILKAPFDERMLLRYFGEKIRSQMFLACFKIFFFSGGMYFLLAKNRASFDGLVMVFNLLCNLVLIIAFFVLAI